VLNAKINRFTSPLFGGSDGVDITERNPFGNHKLTGSPTETTNYVFYTLRRAIRTIADPEVVSMNAASVPGILNSEITKYLIDTCETRADALAVIDVADGFDPREESSSDAASRKGVLNTVLSSHKARNLNSSYGAAYYPWVKVRDDQTGTIVTMPPSVVALGVLANTERAADVWFAPAGFNRGGLSQGAGGLTVVGVEQKLTSRNRDDLYDVNINPIASFPAEGIVVFGQKTLQATPSALDRINVRRLMIFVKRGISRIASATLFQPNVTAQLGTTLSLRADSILV
jgi:phage tail sheath protein FI